MGLTKPRAAQIYNLDYKQATRVVTVANVTLSGGAPNAVDGVNLVLNDRILVTGQSTGSQNGIYRVSTLGTGSNGTWARTSDTNETGEIEAGMIVMVTEGTIYADTQWKLTTNDPITVGTTALTFVQNYSANSISSGNSNVVVNSNSNVTISAAGTANVLTVSNLGAFVSGVVSSNGNVTGGNILTAGVVSATGNVTGNYFIGNVACASGIFTTKIFNGNSEANIGTSGGNANVSIGGTSNVVVFATTGEYITGVLSASGNVTGGNITTAGLITATGNLTGGNILTAGLISATSSITSAANVVGGNLTTAGLITATGNVTGGNLITAGLISATSTVTSAANITGGNLITAGLITATGNITGGNVLTVGQVSATGNVTGNFFFGNGAFLTGISGGGGSGGANISNGATNISIPVSSGNITFSVAGQSNTVVVNLGSFTMYGTFAGPKTLEANVSVANAVNAVIFGPVTIADGFNITVPDASTLYTYSGA